MMENKKLQEARKRAKLTQSQLAEKLGINRATISKYESGDISPTLEQLINIANVLDVSVFSLFDAESANDADIIESTLLTPVKCLQAKLTPIGGKIVSEGNHFRIIYGNKSLAVSADNVYSIDNKMNRHLESLLDFLGECDDWRLREVEDNDERLSFWLE